MRFLSALASLATRLALGLAVLLCWTAGSTRAAAHSLEFPEQRAIAHLHDLHSESGSTGIAGLRLARARTGDVRPSQLKPPARGASLAQPLSPSRDGAVDFARVVSATQVSNAYPVRSGEPEPAPYDATGPPPTAHGQPAR